MLGPTYDELPRDAHGLASAWGLFGPDDSIGRLNLITPDTVRAAASLVRRGASFGLDAPVDEFDPPLDDTRSRVRHRVLRGGGDQVTDLDDVLDDYFPQISSQWDSLAHIPARPGVFYNGRSVEDILERGANTIDHWTRRGVVTRGVLLDLARAHRRDPSRVADTSHGAASIAVKELEAAREAAGVAYSPGCAILVRTGFVEWYRNQDAASRVALSGALAAPGLEHTEEMARYLWNSGAAAVASDTFATEVWPPDWAPAARPFGFLHRVLIGQLGFAIGELWDLEELAADCARDGVAEFLLVSAPLHVRGGIGSPANAVAIK
ncbi:MAG: cyclase family protein [Acidimicrobiales bacterium]